MSEPAAPSMPAWRPDDPLIAADPQARILTLQDWQIGEGALDEADLPKAPRQIGVAITAVDGRIDLAFEDGRHLWVELEDGALRVHSYNRSCEAPLNLTVPASGAILVNRHDYDLHPIRSDEELAAENEPYAPGEWPGDAQDWADDPEGARAVGRALARDEDPAP